MLSKGNKVKIGFVDDHVLFRKGLISLLENKNDVYQVVFEADNGFQMQNLIDKSNVPDIIVMDVNMPQMDGLSSVIWLSENFPSVHVLVVSMIEKESTIVSMVKLKVKGYLGKDVEPVVLNAALQTIYNNGFYYTDFISGKLVHSIQHDSESNQTKNLASLMSIREKEFLQLACSDLTYHEIAAKMHLSPKTIDGYRESLFLKFNVKSRVGLVLFAVKNDIIVI